jgi:CBS domain-containing protein
MTTQPGEFITSLTDLMIGDVMSTKIISCQPEDNLAQVATAMVSHGIHAMLLEPPTGSRPLILSDLELVRAALQRPSDTRAGDLASEPVPTVDDNASVDEAVAKMAELYVRHLLAIDPVSGRSNGVISSLDIVAVLGGYPPLRSRAFESEAPRPAAAARQLKEARAGAVMHPGIVTCAPDARLWSLARSMVEHRVHCVAVAGVGDAGAHGRHFNWGLINDMELVLAAHSGALGEAAATIASAAPPAVNECDSLERAAWLMVNDEAHHVVVIGQSGLPSGMISTLDVARILAAPA